MVPRWSEVCVQAGNWLFPFYCSYSPRMHSPGVRDIPVREVAESWWYPKIGADGQWIARLANGGHLSSATLRPCNSVENYCTIYFVTFLTTKLNGVCCWCLYSRASCHWQPTANQRRREAEPRCRRRVTKNVSWSSSSRSRLVLTMKTTTSLTMT